MPINIKIVTKEVSLDAELFDTECAKSIAGILPLDVIPNEWGDEFYFEIPVHHELDNTATTDVHVGDIGYWPPGKALALFFGPTPMSTGPDPVPASDVNMVGKILGNATMLKNAKGTGKLRIEIS
jgi:hypothetical protein